MMVMISSTDITFPDISSAKAGQASQHFPHITQRWLSVTMPSAESKMAFCSQASTQLPHFMHFDGEYNFSAFAEMLSGLWHQAQCRLHPLKKMTTRMPGPSLMA
jgi:hypothetical protein